MTRKTEFDALQDQIDHVARGAREVGAGGSDFFTDNDDLAPARGILRGVVLGTLMLLAIIAAIAMILMPAEAHANPPVRTVPGTDTPTLVNSVANGGVGGTGGQATAVTSTTNLVNTNPVAFGGSSQAGAQVGTVTAGNQLTVESKLAQAPDVIAYPTAPCRVAIGASGGWLGGALGFSGSVEDEGCTLRETSRQLWNIGQQQAAVQILCLNADAKLALQASGVTCRIERPAPAERVTP